MKLLLLPALIFLPDFSLHDIHIRAMTCMMGEGRIRRRKRRRPLPERRVPLLLLLLSAAVFLRAKEGAGPKSSCCVGAAAAAAAEAQSTEEAAAATTAGIDTGNTGDAGTAADGPASLARGRELLARDRYDEAAPYFWRAVLLHGEQQQGTAEEAYTVEEAFTLFLRCYAAQDRTADGFAYVALESYRRGQLDMAQTYVETALEVDPDHEGALELRGLLQASSSGAGGATAAAAGGGGGATDPDSGKTPEELYHDGTQYFSPMPETIAKSQRGSRRSNATSASAPGRMNIVIILPLGIFTVSHRLRPLPPL